MVMAETMNLRNGYGTGLARRDEEVAQFLQLYELDNSLSYLPTKLSASLDSVAAYMNLKPPAKSHNETLSSHLIRDFPSHCLR